MSSVDEGPGAGAPEQPGAEAVEGDAGAAAAIPAGAEPVTGPTDPTAPTPATPPTAPTPPIWPAVPGAPQGPPWPGGVPMAGAPWPVQPGVPMAAGWPTHPPTAPGGGAWGPPPWGWSPYQEGAPAPQPPAAAGTERRKRAPWVVVVSAIALVLAGLGVGVAVGYGVWNTSQAPAASFRPGALFPNGPSGSGRGVGGGFPPATQSKRAFLGVEVASGSGSGAHVVYVLGTSPAAKAGIADGDTITKFGTTTVTSPTSLRSAIDKDKPGQKVKVAWTTSTGKKQTATVTLSNPSSSQG